MGGPRGTRGPRCPQAQRPIGPETRTYQQISLLLSWMKPTVCPLQCSVPRTADIEKILDIPQFKSPQDWSIQTQHFLLIVATDFFAWLPRSANRSFENHRAILYSVQWYYTHASQYINAVQCNSLVTICLCDGLTKSVCQCKWFARKTIWLWARGSTAAIFIGWDGTIIFHHLYIPWTQKSTVKFALCTDS